MVEVGVSSGVSSAYLLKAMDRLGRGTLHSVDLPKLEVLRPDGHRSRYASWALPRPASGWAVPFPLRKRWDLRLGNKKDVLPLLAEELVTVDIFLYDVPHSDPQSFGEFRQIGRRFHPGSVALVDHGGTEENLSEPGPLGEDTARTSTYGGVDWACPHFAVANLRPREIAVLSLKVPDLDDERQSAAGKAALWPSP